MGKPVLLLRLEAPLQSWGSRSRWDVRDTAAEPTKSGIIGLLGCALGYPTYDPRLEELDAALRFGVRVEHPGRVLIDFQTITDFLPSADGRFKHSGTSMGVSIEKLRNASDVAPATILSPRAYIEDAAFLVGLEATENGDSVLAECARGVQDPRWPLFLGRKTCVPTRPVFEDFTDEFDGLDDALQNCPWSWKAQQFKDRNDGKPASSLTAYVEVTSAERGPEIVTRQDALRTNAARVYGFCTLKRINVDVSTNDAPTTNSDSDRSS